MRPQARPKRAARDGRSGCARRATRSSLDAGRSSPRGAGVWTNCGCGASSCRAGCRGRRDRAGRGGRPGRAGRRGLRGCSGARRGGRPDRTSRRGASACPRASRHAARRGRPCAPRAASPSRPAVRRGRPCAPRGALSALPAGRRGPSPACRRGEAWAACAEAKAPAARALGGRRRRKRGLRLLGLIRPRRSGPAAAGPGGGRLGGRGSEEGSEEEAVSPSTPEAVGSDAGGDGAAVCSGSACSCCGGFGGASGLAMTSPISPVPLRGAGSMSSGRSPGRITGASASSVMTALSATVQRACVPRRLPTPTPIGCSSLRLERYRSGYPVGTPDFASIFRKADELVGAWAHSSPPGALLQRLLLNRT